MNNILKIMTAILVVVFAYSPASADWTIYKSAELKNKEKNILRIDRSSNGPVRAWFMLRRKAEGVFEEKLPLYKVDENKVHDLQLIKNKKIKNGSYIRWEISDSGENISKELIELMNGKNIVFQYYLPDGEIKETTFLLNGAKEATEEVLR